MKFTKYLYLAGLAILFSCGKGNDEPGPEGPQGPQGPNGLKSLLDVQPLAAGTQCSNGGVVVKAGIDKNTNGKLDADEIESTQYVCNGNNGNVDKQIIIPIYMGRNGLGGSAETPFKDQVYKNFNITQYPGVDSVVLFARISNSSTNTPGRVDLFNFTDGIPIGSSDVNSIVGDNSNPILNSKNCFSSFPKKEITLGFQVTAQSGAAVMTSAYMVLYRK